MMTSQFVRDDPWVVVCFCLSISLHALQLFRTWELLFVKTFIPISLVFILAFFICAMVKEMRIMADILEAYCLFSTLIAEVSLQCYLKFDVYLDLYSMALPYCRCLKLYVQNAGP